jgi:multiple sugar transport system substrate-binding protein
VDRRAPLSEFYSAESIASLGEGVRSFRRWGFAQNQASLVAALRIDPGLITEPLTAAIRGDITSAQAAAKAQSAVEQAQASIR